MAKAPKSRRRPGPIGVALKRAREQVGVSQRDLGERAGVHYVTIAMLESGARQAADLETLRRLAKALGVRLADLADPGQVAPVEPLLEEFVASVWAREVLSPPLTEDEIDWLRRLPGIVWRDVPPNPKALYHLIEARRAGSKQ